MKNMMLLITTLVFASLLVGCGMAGPLYRAPEPAAEAKLQKKTGQVSQRTWRENH